MFKYLPILLLVGCATPEIASIHPTYEPFKKVVDREPIGQLYTIEQCQSMKRIDDIDGEWKTPSEFIRDGGGDCEDFAICTLYALRAAGADKNEVFIVMTKDHAVTQYGETIYDVDTKWDAGEWFMHERPIGRFNEYYAQSYRR